MDKVIRDRAATLHNTTTTPEILPRDPRDPHVGINMVVVDNMAPPLVIIQTLNSKDSLTIRLFMEDSQARASINNNKEAVMVHQEDSRFHTPDPPEWLQFRSSKFSRFSRFSKCQLPRSLCTLLQ